MGVVIQKESDIRVLVLCWARMFDGRLSLLPLQWGSVVCLC